MADCFYLLLVLLVVLADHHVVNSDEVPFHPVVDAAQRGAICMDGSPAGYHLEPGYGEGSTNWIVYLKGGGWCRDNKECQYNRGSNVGSSQSYKTVNLTGILNPSKDINPDFYNWNRVYVIYCDQASFLGDYEVDGSGPQLQFRGSRIFRAVMDDLLPQGMYWAENAILAGRSAGGLATILHCDEFRGRLPFTSRVKCISDAGFFIHAKDLPNADYREGFFASTIKFHDIYRFLPVSCTYRIDPNLCLFPEYLVGDVQTPLFILNSAFDMYQLDKLLVPPSVPSWNEWNNGFRNLTNASSAQIQLIKDFHTVFLNTIREIPENPSRGLFIFPCLVHSISTSYSDNQSNINSYWNPSSTVKLENMIILEAVSTWYFDRGTVKVISNADLQRC